MDEHCKRCHRSHKADEFVSSPLDIAGNSFVEAYEGYKEYMRKMSTPSRLTNPGKQRKIKKRNKEVAH